MNKLFTSQQNCFRLSYRIAFSLLLTVGLLGCSAKNSTGVQRIALIAPFEGRYSEIGYDAYYAVRLAVKEHGDDYIELLAIDDGGNQASGSERAKALTHDPLVKVIIALGNNATQPETQRAFENIPVIIVGQWLTKPVNKNIYMLASNQLERVLTASVHTFEEDIQVKAPVVGGEIFALSQFASIGTSPGNVTIASSASLPDANFRQRYLSSGQYVSEPGLLATLTYDAAAIALKAVQSTNPNQTISDINYKGLNGNISFVDGYWADAPIYYYRYDSNGTLTPKSRSTK